MSHPTVSRPGAPGHLFVPNQPGHIKVNKIGPGQGIEFQIGHNEPWLYQGLKKMMESWWDDELADLLNKKGPCITLTIRGARSNQYEDHFFLEGKAHGPLFLQCVRCLDLFAFPLNTKFNACFLHERFQKSTSLEEETDIYIEDKLYELYFYQGQSFEITTPICEAMALSIPPLPLHDENCLGLCDQCGANWNRESCSHGQNSRPVH